MNELPHTGFLRLSQIIGNRKATPPIPPIIPIGKTAWWAGVKTGRFPEPVKLGPRTTVWKVEDIRRLIEEGIQDGLKEPPLPRNEKARPRRPGFFQNAPEDEPE